MTGVLPTPSPALGVMGPARDFLRNLRHSVLFDKGENGRFQRCQTRMKLHHDARLQFPFLVRCFIFVVGLTQERQCRTIGSGRRFNHVWNILFTRQIVAIAKVFTASAPTRLPMFVLLHFKSLRGKLSFHVTPKIKVPAMSDSFKLAE